MRLSSFHVSNIIVGCFLLIGAASSLGLIPQPRYTGPCTTLAEPYTDGTDIYYLRRCPPKETCEDYGEEGLCEGRHFFGSDGELYLYCACSAQNPDSPTACIGWIMAGGAEWGCFEKFTCTPPTRTCRAGEIPLGATGPVCWCLP